MKKIILFIFLTALASCKNKEALTVYYETPNGKLLSEKQYNDYKKDFIKNNTISDSTIINLNEEIINETEKGDSLIKKFKMDIQIFSGKQEEKEHKKLYSLIGKKLPESKLETYTGNFINLSDYQGKPVVINFWFTSCPPCVEEMPALNKLKEKYAGKVEFIGITFNDKKQVEAFLKKFKFDYNIIVNAKPFIDQIGFTAYPQNLFLDKNGVVKEIIPSIYENDTKEFEIIIETLL